MLILTLLTLLRNVELELETNSSYGVFEIVSFICSFLLMPGTLLADTGTSEFGENSVYGMCNSCHHRQDQVEHRGHSTTPQLFLRKLR